MARIGTGKLRELNDQKILQLLVEKSSVTKKELAGYSGLTVATIGTILNDFVIAKTVIEQEVIHGNIGRPTKRYSLNPTFFYNLLIFVQYKQQKNFLHWQINDAHCNCQGQGKIECDEMVVDQMMQLIVKKVAQYPLIKIIGIAVPGIISSGEIIESDILELKGVRLKEMVAANFNLPVIVKNEMNFTAMGYYDMMNVKSDISYLIFPFNSGPGCGSIINGALLEVENSIAGEILYLPFFNFLKQKNNSLVQYTLDEIALSLTTIASVINPAIVILTGEKIKENDIVKIKEKCLAYIPEKFMPKIIYRENYEKDCLMGMRTYVIKEYIEQRTSED